MMNMRKVLLFAAAVVCLRLSYHFGQSSVHFTRRERTLQEVAGAQLQDPIARKVRRDAQGVIIPEPTFNDESWEMQKRNPILNERIINCTNGDAAIANKQGFDVVQQVVHGDHRIRSEDEALQNALSLFIRAHELEPACPVFPLNGAIVAFATANWTIGLDLIAVAISTGESFIPSIIFHKALLWKQFYAEQGHPQTPHALLIEASRKIVRMQPSFGLDYYGLRAKDMIEPNVKAPVNLITRDSNQRYSEAGQVFVHRAVSRLLLMKEFAEYVGGYPVLTAPEARQFPERFYIYVRGMLSPYMLANLQEYYRQMISHGQFSDTDPQAKRFCTHNDPPTRFVLVNYRDMVNRLMDSRRQVIPTYTYFGSYYGGASLYPHRDRLQCEFTLTVNIDINPIGGQCPLGFSPKVVKVGPEDAGGRDDLPDPADRIYVYHRPGDGVLIKGREVTHWRDPMPVTVNCTQFFLHYVFDDFKKLLA